MRLPLRQPAGLPESYEAQPGFGSLTDVVHRGRTVFTGPSDMLRHWIDAGCPEDARVFDDYLIKVGAYT